MFFSQAIAKVKSTRFITIQPRLFNWVISKVGLLDNLFNQLLSKNDEPKKLFNLKCSDPFINYSKISVAYHKVGGLRNFI